MTISIKKEATNKKIIVKKITAKKQVKKGSYEAVMIAIQEVQKNGLSKSYGR
jgi:hypothetical protein